MDESKKATTAQLTKIIVPEPSRRKKIEELSGQKISACFQCEKCTNGCPLTFAMDIAPHKAIRLLCLGQVDEVLRSDTIWVCASCETCTTRCPNNIDIAHIMDSLRQTSLREGIKPSQKNVPVFHAAFLSSIRKHGRVYEPEMAVNYALRSGGVKGLMQQAGLGIAMFSRGKIKLLPARVQAKKQVKNIFRKARGKG